MSGKSKKSDKTNAIAYAVWPTAWGPMGAVASQHGLCHINLPHYQLEELAELIAWEHPSAKRDRQPFEPLVALSRDYFNGQPADFSAIVCDLPSADSFFGRVYRACRDIPAGQTRSYRQLAEMVGQGDAARAVATAMSKNPIPLVVPCHRVIYSDGRAGGFSAEGGPAMKQRMLSLEKAD